MKKEILLRILIFFILSLKINIFYAQIPNYVPSSGLVGWWPFNGNANDESGNGNNGTVTGATLSDDRNGIPNKAYYFSSSGCATRIDANVNTTTIQSGLSISIWVLRSGNGCIGPRIFEFWPGNNGPGQAQWGWDNSTSVIGMGSTTSTGFGCNSSVPIPANNVWIHLVYTNDGSVGKFYSNGNLVSTVASNGNPILAGSVSFGRMNHPSWDAFNGKLDDIGVWSRALTECEVQQLYLSQTSVSGNIVNAGPDQTICSGSSVTLSAIGASTYSWSGGIQNGVPFIPTSSSQYIVTGTNVSGCSGTDTVNVNVLPAPVITVTNDTICSGQSTTLTASISSNCGNLSGSLTNGLVGYWPFCGNANDESGNGNNGIVNGSNFGNNRFLNSNSSINQTVNGSYVKTQGVINNVSNNFTISLWANPSQADILKSQGVVGNEGYGLMSIIHPPHGSNFGSSSNHAGVGINVGNNQVQIVEHTHMYISSPLVYVAPLIGWHHILLVYDQHIPKLYVDGNLVATGLQSSIQYVHPGSGFCSTYPQSGFGSSFTPNGTPIGNYKGDFDDIGIWNRTLTTAEIQQLYAQGQATYSWTPGGATTPSITVSPTSTTTYTCAVTDANGSCSSDFMVTVNPMPNVNAVPDQTICSSSSVTLTATGANNYSWTGGIQNGVPFVPTISSQYIVTGTNVSGCSGADTVNVNVIPAPVITVTNDTVCSGQNTTLTASISSNCGNLSGSLSNGLVGYWPFCGNAMDVSGTGNHGTTLNGVSLTTDRFGFSNNAYNFDGLNDVITVLDNNTLDFPNGQFSLMAWVKVNNLGVEMSFIDHLDNGSPSIYSRYELRRLTNNKVRFILKDMNNVSSYIDSDILLDNTSSWFHIVGTFNSSTQTIKLFINGMEQTGTITLQGTGNSITPPGILQFGKYGDQIYSNTHIDDIGIWNRTLTAAEIQQLYTLGQTTYSWSPGGASTISITVSPTTTTTYTCTVTNANGTSCSSTQQIEVSQLQVNAGQNQTICSGSSVTLTATGASSYAWTGGIQNGISFFPTASGQYIVSGTNSFGCSGSDTVQVTVVPNPVITALDSVICAGDTTQLIASAPTIGAGQSCTGTSPVNYTLWTPIAVTDSYTNIIKEGTNYFLRAQNNVYQASSLIGPWSSMNFNTQIGNTLAGRMFGMDWNNRLFVSTGHNSLYAYNNGAWLDMGLGGFGCSGNFIHKLANGRIIVEKNGYLRDLYISDNNGTSFTNVTNVDNDYFDMIVAPNGNIYACGGSNTPSMTGLIKSTNNGTSFTQINSQLGIAYCSGFAKDCSGSIYAVADNKIFKSIDGNTWQQQCLIPAAFTSNPGYSFLVVASNGDYYLWGYANASINGLFKSSNLGQTWSQITDLPVTVANVTNLKEIDGNIVVVTTQGIYAKTILQSPTFVWSTGSTTPTISVSPSTTTTYTVTVDYGNGLTCSSSFTITVNQLPLVNAGIDQSVCAGSSVTLSATGATNYSWSGGVQNGVAFVPSTSGQYIVTSANSGCVGLDTVVITVNSNPTITGTITNPLCNANQAGEISISISSGQAPYTVLWSNGASANSIQNLSSGNYLVTITDTNNCSASQSFSIVSPSPLSISSVVANSNCTNSATGAIDISVSGGTAPYFYTWSNGATIQDLTNLLGGTYSVTVTDNNGCTVSDSFQITQTTGLSITANVVNPTCGTTNNGLIDISVFGGTPAYAYLWSNGSSTQDLSGLGTGTYSVSVTDANGCVATGLYTLSAPIPLNITFTNNNIGCFGNSTGYINSNVTGGQSPYSYFWNTGANTPNITNVIAGTYILTVNDVGGCTSTSSVQIYQPQLPLVISAAITPSQCFGANNGSIDISATGGTVLYNYNWSNGATTQDLQNISAGNYSLILTDGNGCVYDTAFVVSQPALPLTSQTSQVNVSCQNGNNGFVNLTVSGGQQPYSYNWSNGQTTQDLLSLSAGTYTLILTDGNGCIAYDTVTIVQPSNAFSLGGAITNVACFGASTGFIDLNVSGGVAPYTYIWNNGGSNQDLSNLQAGNYNVIVFDANNCQASQSFSISQPTFNLQANTVVEDLICTSNETGSIDVTVTGGTSPYSYLWTNGQTVQDLINVGTGNYSLTISDYNGCQITLSENISAPAQPLTTSATTGNVSCFGLADGQITLATLGGVSPYVYQWSNGQTASLIDSLTAGLYSVLVTDANGCENSLSVQISQPNQILNNFSSSTQLGCIPAQIDFTYPVNDPTLSFSWDFGNGQSSNVQNPSFTYLAAGCFDVSLTITAANGCVVNSILDSMICIVQGPEAAFYSNSSTIDFYTGELALFDNSEGSILTYLWTLGDSSPNQTTQNIIHYYTPYTEENYNVSLTVTDTNGCSDVATMVFSLIEEFEIYVPNTITLNGDLLNDGFLPIFSNVDILKDYELVIYNRWGNLVWQTTNPTEPWFGRYKDAYDVQVGTYTWKIKYTDNQSVTRSLVGHVNVLK